ncbi:hypothetical protein [Dactylosporangium sp. NPDC006015]|uniref:hypothetical protein n=1 Tax=Dactylosporangium sp. NPDC006015 TaxID=3154576 RepID=UPI0033A05DD5
MTASLSRRRFLSGTGIAALGLTAPSLLAACGGGSGGSTGRSTGSSRSSATACPPRHPP